MEASAVLHFKQNQTSPVDGGRLEDDTMKEKLEGKVLYVTCGDNCS